MMPHTDLAQRQAAPHSSVIKRLGLEQCTNRLGTAASGATDGRAAPDRFAAPRPRPAHAFDPRRTSAVIKWLVLELHRHH